jgi:hypothetical protein
MSRYLRVADIFLLLVMVALVATTGCQKESTSEPKGQSAATKQVTVEVTGMT